MTKLPEVVIDLAANTSLPNGKQVEKWEGLTIGPRLKDGSYVIVAGNDNDYSVTQEAGTNVQFDVYVDFNGGSVRRDLDQAHHAQRPVRWAGARGVHPPPGRAPRLQGLGRRPVGLRAARDSQATARTATTTASALATTTATMGITALTEVRFAVLAVRRPRGPRRPAPSSAASPVRWRSSTRTRDDMVRVLFLRAPCHPGRQLFRDRLCRRCYLV